MVEQKTTVQLDTGLQARPAAMFVQEANRYNAEITLEKDGKKVNAKSIMGIMSLAVGKGTEVSISADGEDQEQALKALVSFLLGEK
jgi:catabolite repression HPr-like protein